MQCRMCLTIGSNSTCDVQDTIDTSTPVQCVADIFKMSMSKLDRNRNREPWYVQLFQIHHHLYPEPCMTLPKTFVYAM